MNAWAYLLCVLAGCVLVDLCSVFGLQEYGDEAGASSAMPSPRAHTAASQLSPVFEDHMRPNDETAGMGSAQCRREQQSRSAGNHSLSRVKNTGQILCEMLLSDTRA